MDGCIEWSNEDVFNTVKDVFVLFICFKNELRSWHVMRGGRGRCVVKR